MPHNTRCNQSRLLRAEFEAGFVYVACLLARMALQSRPAGELSLFPKSQVKNRKATKKPNRFVRRNRRISLFFKGRNLASLDAVHPPGFATLTAGGGGSRFARAFELSLFSLNCF